MTYPEPVNLTTIPDIMRYNNTVSDGLFGVSILISWFFLIFLYVKNRGASIVDSALAASLTTTLLGIFLFFTGIVNEKQLFMCVLIYAFSMLWAYFGKE